MSNRQYPVPYASSPGGGGGGSGTVTSVTFTGDGAILSSTPSSAVTTSGTLNATAATQSGNVVIASPANGSSGLLSARALVPADLAGVGVVSGLGYETLPWGSGAFMAPGPGAVGQMDGSTNRCRFAIFSLMETLKMTTLSVNVTTTASTQKIFIGIYDAANTTLLGQWTFTLGAGTGVLSATKVGGGSLTLSPGPYMYVWASDSTTPVVSGYAPAGGSGNIFGSLMNKNATRIGQGAAGSPVSAGTMPPNLGTLVAAATINVPGVFVEP